jgi:stage V sporulation protein D (sporulation-specific penicillin-binding protein)
LQFGGIVAAPIVGNIIEDSLSAMGVEKQKGQIEKEKTWLDAPEVVVPNLVGKKTKELTNLLYNLKIETSGKGNYIVQQAPQAGVKLQAGKTIRLFLGDKKDVED